ncbi:butyrophilin subfamily 1 member A1-like [Sceloporus undulatus]|uniref:butyrophilin subfamily 1 member A1-like n=1 Tax=Sceloporus undulatus TaxID=8520 RepID=UPI001C4A8434|nr:butyrophilin subfamily 1 member A1-like [Sceloporus undulatus]
MEDEDGYMSIDPRKRDLCAATASKESKGSFSNLLWWKIALGISVAGNVVVVVVLLILLSLPAPQAISYSKPPHNQIQSCLLNCIPCGSAKNSRTANLTLDPGTAFPQLYISEDQKTVTWKGMKQSVAPCTMRYDVMASVLSHEGFTSGKICWEVEVVEGGTWWGVGVVRESANRNGPIFLAPGGGYWGVQRIDGQYQAITEPRTNLSLCHPPKRIRVSLDYSVGQVAFFDGDTHAELFTFPKTHFSGEKILPWFLIHGWNGKLMIHP